LSYLNSHIALVQTAYASVSLKNILKVNTKLFSYWALLTYFRTTICFIFSNYTTKLLTL